MSWILSHSYDKLGKGKGEFEYARGIIVSEKTGNITVADISNKRIQVNFVGVHFRSFFGCEYKNDNLIQQ